MLRNPTNSELRRALALALTYVEHLEPPDSRAVSDEFVAMAAMIHGDTSDEAVAIIDSAMRERCG